MCKESPWSGDKTGKWKGAIIKDFGAAAAKAVKVGGESY
jgi:hypothetical protein